MEIYQLVKRAKENDEAAFSELYERTVKRAYFYTLKSVNNEDEAKNIVQNAYISCFNNINQLEDNAKFENWLTVSISRKIKNYFNRSKIDKSTTVFSHLDKEEEGLLFVDSLEDKGIEFQPDIQVDYNELKQAMAEIIDELKPDQRMAILLYYFEGQSIKEIADSLDVSVSAIKSKLNYSRNKIKEKVEMLQKGGKPIFGIMPIPFMVWLLKEEAKAMELPQSLTTYISGSNTATTIANHRIANALSKKIIGAIISAVVVIGGTVIGLNQSTPEVKEQISYLDKEIPQFEATPEDMYNKGYLVMVDGKYGFINNDGEWVLENKYDMVLNEPLVDEFNETTLLGFDLAERSTYLENQLGLAHYQSSNNLFIDYPLKQYVTIRWFSNTEYEIFWYDMNTNERIDFQKLHDPSQPQNFELLSYLKDCRDNMLIVHPTDQVGMLNRDIYYAITKEGKAFGPFYARLSLCKSTHAMERGETTVVKGLFINSTVNGYQVLDEKGNVVENQYFDYAEIISYDAIKVSKDNQIGIVNRDGLVFIGDFEDVSNCIENRAYVKKDGLWQLVQINEL